MHFNAAIDACGKSGRWEEALSLLREMASMPSDAMRPDAFSFSSAISAQAKAPDGWRRALALLRAMRMHGLEPSRYCYNAAITVCGSGGEWRRALQLLSAMEDRPNPPPDVYSFNTAIAACGRAGQWVAALELLERATSLGVCDVVTFSSAMGALRNSGRWEQALEVLGRMDAAGAASMLEVPPLIVPQFTALVSPGSWAALRTRSDQLSRSEASARLRCGREARPESPIPRRPTPRRAAQPGGVCLGDQRVRDGRAVGARDQAAR